MSRATKETDDTRCSGVVRRLRAGQTDRAVARELGVSRKTVTKYRKLAEKAELLEGLLPPAGEFQARLDRILPPSAPAPRSYSRVSISRDSKATSSCLAPGPSTYLVPKHAGSP